MMDGAISLEASLMLVIATCLFSWLVGDIFGAARVRRTARTHRGASSEETPLLYSTISGDISASQETTREICAPQHDDGHGPTNFYQLPMHALARVIEPGQRLPKPRVRIAKNSNSLMTSDRAEFPPFEIEVIGRDAGIWRDPALCRQIRDADPAAARTLARYKAALKQMRMSGPEMAIIVEQDHRLPRFSDVAPLNPCTRAAQLAVDRLLSEKEVYRAIKCEVIA